MKKKYKKKAATHAENQAFVTFRQFKGSKVQHDNHRRFVVLYFAALNKNTAQQRTTTFFKKANSVDFCDELQPLHRKILTLLNEKFHN